MNLSKKYTLPLGYSLSEKEIIVGFGKPNTHSPTKQKSELFYDRGEAHRITIAPTGKGKGRNAMIPACLTYPGSMIILGIKGEVTAVTARHRRTLGKVYVLDPFHLGTQQPDTFNILDVSAMVNDSTETLAKIITKALVGDVSKFTRDRFWENMAEDLLSGGMAYILDNALKKNRNLTTLRNMFSADDIVYYLAKLLDTHKKDMNPMAYRSIARFLQASDRVRSDILTTAQQYIHIFDDPRVAASIENTSIDLDGLFHGDPVTIYIEIPPTKLKSHAPLLRLWLDALINLLLERRQRPALPTLMMVDEAAQLGGLDSLHTATTLMRGYGLRIWTFWQDLSQLKHLYKDDWQTLLNNLDVLEVFGVNTWLMAQELAEILGCSAQELLRLPHEQAMLNLPGGQLKKVKKLDYLKDKQFQGLYDPNPMYANTPSRKNRKPGKKALNLIQNPDLEKNGEPLKEMINRIS